MPDGFVRLRKGEKQPVYGQETVASGTLTIQASPAPAVTLYSAGGIGIVGFVGVAVTGYDTAASASPRVWLNLDTSGLTPGFYTLVFLFTALGSDGISRVCSPAQLVQVQEVTA